MVAPGTSPRSPSSSWSFMESIRRPTASTRSPSALSSSRRPALRNRGSPHWDSSRFSCRLTAERVRPTLREARARVPVS